MSTTNMSTEYGQHRTGGGELRNLREYLNEDFGAAPIVNAGDSLVAGGLIYPVDDTLLPLGAQISAVPQGVTRLKVDTGVGEGELLYLWEPSGDFDSAARSITNIVANAFAGYTVTADGTDYEFTTQGIRYLRGKSPSPISIMEVYPEGWGAIADGDISGSGTDASSNIQKAHDEANILGAKLILTGKYLLNSQVVFTAGSVIGTDRISTGFYKNFDGDAIRLLGEKGHYADFFVTNAASNAADTGNGIVSIVFEGCKRQVMERILCNRHGNNGFDIASGNLGHFENLEAISNGNHGMRFGGFDANAMTAVGLDARLNGVDGIHNDQAYNFICIGGYTTLNGRYGWFIGNNDGKYWGIGGEIDTVSTVYLDPGSARNYVVIGEDSRYVDDSSVTNANTIVASRDETKLHANLLTVRNAASDDSGGIAFRSSSSGYVEVKKDDATRNFKVSLLGTTANADVDISEMGAGRGVIVRDVSDGNRYRISVLNGVLQTVDLGP